MIMRKTPDDHKITVQTKLQQFHASSEYKQIK